MKASTTTNSVKLRDGRALERTRRRTIVALALRDKALAAKWAARLTAECDAVALVCTSGETQLEAWLEENRADVLLIEERWLHRLGADAVPNVGARWPYQCVLLVGDRACTALAEHVVRNRFQGFLLATDAADSCVKAVRTAKRGDLWVPRALLVELLFEHLHARSGSSTKSPDDKLTPREVEVIGYVRRGFANKQIGDALAIREDTVKKHLRNAYTKLGVHRRAQIITSVAERLVIA